MIDEPRDRPPDPGASPREDLRIAQVEGPGASSAEEFDPATASLADALRKSFGVLKVLMFVLVVLYLLSGLFSVKSDERGIRYRFGDVVGRGTPDAVLDSGWKWSWPFPIEQWETLSVKERELPVEFMLELSDQERSTGTIQRKLRPLSPERDDYLVTGDVNILHASLVIKYQISDVIDYVTNVYPMPDPHATVHSKPYRHYPEYTLLRNLARDAVIETAARQPALDIRGSRQDAFLLAIARTLNRKLKTLADRGAPPGISIDENNGVIAPKQTGSLEAIMPPRQTQEVFDRVFAAQTGKSGAIIKARSEAEALLVNTAGPNYYEVAAAIDREFELIRRLSDAEGQARGAADPAKLAALREALREQRAQTEKLLRTATGAIRATIRAAQIRRDAIIKEATGDYNQFIAVAAESRRNPAIFFSRLREEMRARILAGQDVTKVYVPPNCKEIRLNIKREGRSPVTEEENQKKKKSILELTPPEIVKPTLQ